MAAPFFDAGRSLIAHREDLVYLFAGLLQDPITQDLAASIKQLIDAWPAVYTAQLTHWDAQTHAQVRVAMADKAIDDHIDAFAPALLDVVGGSRTSPRYRMYFATAPSDLKRFILGEELAVVREWPTLLAAEEDVTLRKHAQPFAAEVEAADRAVAERAEADAKNTAFRTTGVLATYVERVRDARDHVWLELERRRLADKSEKLPRDWTTRFFAAHAPTDDEAARKARIAQREKAREARDAAAERRKGLASALKKAQSDLREHDKSTATRSRR